MKGSLNSRSITDDRNVPMIKAKSLTKVYGKVGKLYKYIYKTPIRAVNNIDFTVKQGVVHGFLGPNGAGKTTTIKMLVGAIGITSGRAFVKGEPAGSVAARKMIGYLPEHPTFYGGMNAFNYLRYMARLGGIPKAEVDDRVVDVLDMVELSDVAFRSIKGYSAGMKQRLGLAQTLVHQPELLILDEPTANLDAIGRASIIEKIRRIVDERGLTVFVSSHILSEIERMADNVTIIHHGKIVVDKDIKSLKREFSGNHYVLDTSKNDHVYNLLKDFEGIESLWRDEEGKIQLVAPEPKALRDALPSLLAKKKISLREFTLVQLSLDAIFIRVVEKREGQ